jgi:transcriptional regulator with XRE-family HTH domain
MDRLSIEGPVYKFLEAHGLTQRELSRQIGMSHVTVSMVVSGRRRVPRRLVRHWIELGISTLTIQEWMEQQDVLMGKRQDLKTRRAA